MKFCWYSVAVPDFGPLFAPPVVHGRVRRLVEIPDGEVRISNFEEVGEAG